MAPPDVTSPLIEIVFPDIPGALDRDGDGLLDIEVRFSEMMSGIDPTTIRLVSDRPLKTRPGAGINLLDLWHIAKADSTGLIIEEAVEALLPRGIVRLTIVVEDRAGNTATEVFRVDLPPMAFHRQLVFNNTPPAYLYATRLLSDHDRGRLFLTQPLGSSIALLIVDVESLESSLTILPIVEPLELALDSRRGRLYIADYGDDDVFVIDAASGVLLDRVIDSSPWFAGNTSLFISSRDDELYAIPAGGNLFFADSTPVAQIGVSDLEDGSEKRLLQLKYLPSWGYEVLLMDGVLDESTNRLFIGTADWTLSPQGILVVDAETGALRGQLDLIPEEAGRLGGTSVLRRDGEWVVGLTDSYSGHMFRFRPARPDAIEFEDLGGLRPLRFAIPPDGSEYALLAGRGDGEWNRALVLVNANTLQTAWQDTTPMPALLWDLDFGAGGNLLFLAGTDDDTASNAARPTLLVYLHR